jgi:hypothetical protein
MDMMVVSINGPCIGVLSLLGVPYCSNAEPLIRFLGALCFCKSKGNFHELQFVVYFTAGWTAHCFLCVSVAVDREALGK